MALIYLSCAWLAGIFLGSKFNLPPALISIGLAPLPLFFFARQHRKLLILTSLCLFTLLGGAFYSPPTLPTNDEGYLQPEWVYSLRNHLSRTIAEVLPEPQASLAQGIVLGIRGNIPSSVKTDFINTGTAHILAISGQNLSIVAGMLLSLFIWLLGKRHYLYIWLSLSIIWFYVLLTGVHPPVVRGAIMASLFLAAELLGRQRSAITALAFAAAVMVGISPRVLWDASFQMSFVATAGLIFVYPLIQSAGRKTVGATLGEGGIAVSIANLIIDNFSVSLGATLAVWPLIAYYFHIISWAAPVATFFALPVLPGIIVTGALAGVLGLIALPVAWGIGWCAWFFLSYLLLVVKVFAAIPFIEGIQVDTIIIWVYYSALMLFIWLCSNKDRMAKVTDWLKSGIDKSSSLFSRMPKKWVVTPLLVVAILVSVTVATLPDDNLHISFLDVGQGDAILIQRGSQQILVDGGPSPQAVVLALGKAMPFWDRTIDLVVLTHPHIDHVTGLVEVLNRYRVEQVLYPDLEYESPLYDEWLGLLREQDIEYTLAQSGQEIDFSSGVTLEVLNPPKPLLTGTESDVDNNGVVLRLKMGRVSFLFTADIMREAEFELIARRANLTSTVLKVAHHGSATSTSKEFLAVVNPRLAVISVGQGNPFGHPSGEVMDRLEEKLGQENIYRTDKNGTIDFITDGERLWVRVEK